MTVFRKRCEVKPKKTEKEYLLVDGYNIIFAWEELKELGVEYFRNFATDNHGGFGVQ